MTILEFLRRIDIGSTGLTREHPVLKRGTFPLVVAARAQGMHGCVLTEWASTSY
jgi:hypothetical protein